jgi:hypothetical protein
MDGSEVKLVKNSIKQLMQKTTPTTIIIQWKDLTAQKSALKETVKTKQE